jgi:hypothetical protein
MKKYYIGWKESKRRDEDKKKKNIQQAIEYGGLK